MNILAAFLFLFISGFSYGNEFCDSLVESLYKGEIYLIPPGRTYEIQGSNKVYIYSAPNSKCLYEKNISLVESERVQVYAEYEDFLSVMYFRGDGGSIEGWVRKENLSKINESVSP